MKAIWGSDYDMHTDKCYECPCCPKCKEPIFLHGDKYYCVSCGKEVEPTEEMFIWLSERAEEKTEMEDCFPKEIELKDGTKIKMGCGEKKCVEVHYRRNPVTLEWETMGGKCTKCGMSFIV